MFSSLIEKLTRREDLTSDEAAAAMEDVMNGAAAEAQIAGLLVGLVMKGERPAEIVGLPDQGRPIALGEPATFVLVDPEEVWTVRGARLASRAANTPYEGMRLPAMVVATVLRGRVTARDGQVVA